MVNCIFNSIFITDHRFIPVFSMMNLLILLIGVLSLNKVFIK